MGFDKKYVDHYVKNCTPCNIHGFPKDRMCPRMFEQIN